MCLHPRPWLNWLRLVEPALLRACQAGPTVIISPLLALMRNQIDPATRAGIVAKSINSTNLSEWNDVYAEILDGKIDVLLVSPERLNHPDFRDYILPTLAATTGMVVVDEAHCISDLGARFSPRISSDSHSAGWAVSRPTRAGVHFDGVRSVHEILDLVRPVRFEPIETVQIERVAGLKTRNPLHNVAPGDADLHKPRSPLTSRGSFISRK